MSPLKVIRLFQKPSTHHSRLKPDPHRLSFWAWGTLPLGVVSVVIPLLLVLKIVLGIGVAWY